MKQERPRTNITRHTNHASPVHIPHVSSLWLDHKAHGLGGRGGVKWIKVRGFKLCGSCSWSRVQVGRGPGVVRWFMVQGRGGRVVYGSGRGVRWLMVHVSPRTESHTRVKTLPSLVLPTLSVMNKNKHNITNV